MRKTRLNGSDEKLVNSLFSKRCANIQIPVMRLNEIFEVGRSTLANTSDEEKTGDAMNAKALEIQAELKAEAKARRSA